MPHSERHEELVAAMALGVLLDADRAELERHLAEGCARCEVLLVDLREASTALASEVPAARPPDGRGARPPAPPAPPGGPARRASPVFARVLAAAAVLLLVLVGLDDA